MKKLSYLTLALAAFAMVGMSACNSTVKETATEEVIEVVVEKTEPCSDSTAVADTTVEVIVEETVE